jgi:signal transduction histidine kinase
MGPSTFRTGVLTRFSRFPGGIVPRLIVIKGADEGKQYDLTEPVIGVGRDGSNRLRLSDTEVSRRHAEFRQTQDGYRLVDIGSANGTFVNNTAVKDVLLQSGDHVQIGQSTLVYSAGRADTVPVADLAERISMISKHDLELGSAIVKTIGETEGSRILAKPDQDTGPWLKNALANLSVMYDAIQAVSHILDVNQLLERIMDLIFRSIAADRGCIMLRNADNGQFEPQAARWREGFEADKIAVSRTVMDYVLSEKKGILASDAAQDDRFSAGQSIVRFGIREVICVPMKGRHETLGVLYLDTRSSAKDFSSEDGKLTGKFNADHLALAIAIGHQAALAVEESRYHQALVQAERLAAIGQTIAALSHHIKNILQGLRSGSDILKMGLKDKNEGCLQQGWRMIEKNQEKIYNLVMDMLSFSKEREPSLEDADLNSLIREVLELTSGRAKEVGAKIETRLDPDLPRVPIDPEGIHRALLNVVGNALDAVDDEPNPSVAVASIIEPDREWVRILVIDNGGGIPSEKLTDIFKPFVSTKGSRGTGLGLPVSRKILREHGGDLTAHSGPGRQTKFTLRIPVRSPLRSESAAAEPEQPGGEPEPIDFV